MTTMEKAMRNGRKKRLENKPLFRLDLGCGQNKREGFHGVDIADMPGVDTVCDLLKFPWPFKDESVTEVHCSHFFEHVPKDKRYGVMDELYRVLVPVKTDPQNPNRPIQGFATFICPYYTSVRAIGDPSHEWPPIAEWTFLYFNRKWREDNKLTHYPVSCDFDFVYGFTFDPIWAAKNDEMRAYGSKHYCNVIADIQVTLTKRVANESPQSAR